MAVHHNDDNQNQQQTQQPNNEGFGLGAGGPASGGNADQRGAARPMGVMGLAGRFKDGGLGRSSVGEAVMKYTQVFREIIQEHAGDGETGIRVTSLDGQAQGLAMSSVLVTLTSEYQGQPYVGVYTILIESSIGGRLQNRQVNMGQGTTAEYTAVPGDVCDDTYRQAVETVVRERHGKGAAVLDAGYTVIPVECSVEERDNLRKVLFHANKALVDIVSKATGQQAEPTTVRDIVDSQVVLTSLINYDTLPDHNAAGLPVRSDLSVALQASSSSGAQGHHEQVLDITKVDGFIDLVYDANQDSQQQASPFGWAPQQQAPQRFYPRLVITDNDTQVDAITPELQLLALSSTTVLSTNMAWAGVFVPDYNAGSVDLRDIGAVGYEFNLTNNPQAEPAPVDTKADDFSTHDLQALIGTLVHDQLIYCIDVEEAGELSWIHGAFVAASRGSQSAHNSIVRAADNLTGGLFSQNFGNEPIVSSDNNRIHLGYWDDDNGNRRDLRDWDYLAMANYVGSRDIGLVREFVDTFDQVNIPIEMRLERRERIYSAVLGSNYKIKGYAQRLTFNPKFIIALQRACEGAGLVVRTGNVSQNFGKLNVRGRTDLSQFSVSGLSGNMFQSNQPQWGGHRGGPAQQAGFFNGHHWF